MAYLIIGTLVNFYYHFKYAEKYSKQLMSGEISVGKLMLGGFLTILLWPVAIYNNEFKKGK